jgi:hypothetical protein
MAKHQQTFGHLRVTGAYVPDSSEPRGRFAHLNDGGPTGLADQIVVAAEKSRTPTGTGVSSPRGPAAKILAAARKLRGEV